MDADVTFVESDVYRALDVLPAGVGAAAKSATAAATRVSRSFIGGSETKKAAHR